jgi:glycosyltransferase involved in cell wall biosynthesis
VTPLAEALVDLAADPDKRQRLGSTGRRLFTEQFRHEHMSGRLRELYQSILERPAR